MAIQFNPSALSAFSNVNFRENDAIANLGENGELVKHGTRGFGVFAKIRSTATQDKNNAVRTELLKALGRAFNLEGVSEQGGKTTFSKDFMDRLEGMLGPEFKRGDFGIKDGAVNSGKPLTQRRIKAIFKAAALVKAETQYDAKTYLAKVDSIIDWFKKERDPDAQSTKTGLSFFTNVRRMIEFAESDFEGLAKAYSGGKVDECNRFIFSKIGMFVAQDSLVKKAPKEAHVENKDAGKVINIDNIGYEIETFIDKIKANPDNVEPERDIDLVKKNLKQSFEALAKLSVDICLKLKGTDQIEDFIEVIFQNDMTVNFALEALEKYQQEI